MIRLHHLNHSRSQRVLWLLEELALPYELVKHERDPQTNLGPPALKQVHPLGKSPVIEDDGEVIAESGAIVEYLVRRYPRPEAVFAPAPDIGDPLYRRYLQWMHFAEGSAMLPLLLKLYVGRLEEAGKPLWPRIESELRNHFDFISTALGTDEYFVGNTFGAADVQMSFVLEAGAGRGPLADYPNLRALLARLQARPAYQRALDAGGPYRFAPRP